jgi:hypothetical protein
MKIDTMGELMVFFTTRPALKIAWDMAMSETYEEWTENVHRAVDHALDQMAQNPELRKDKSEDQLTIELVSLLAMMDIEASHDTKIGGHVDIRVKGANNRHWLAEAKRHVQDYGWLLEGFQQLSDRYSTGRVGQDRGGLIIYSSENRIDRTMERWKDRLAKSVPQITVGNIDPERLTFDSAHPHVRTGRPLHVRHVPVSFHHDPIV